MKRNNLKKIKILLWLLMMTYGAGIQPACFGDVWDRVEIPSSPNPVGSGARALGMGGAFIAIADDATAASWNPGGLIQLERPEFSIVGAAFHRIDDNTFINRPEASGEQSVSETRINYLSFAYPFHLGRNMILSINYQNLYDFTRQWNLPLITDDGKNWSDSDYGYELDGSLSAIGIAYAVQITPQFSFGFTVNFWEDFLYENEWEEKRFQKGFGFDRGNAFIEETSSYEKYSFSGINANIGFLWRVNSRFTMGGVLKTPFEADLEHDHLFDSLTNYPNIGHKYESATLNPYHENATLKMPLSYGIGFACRFSDSFTLSGDIYRTEWDDFIYKDEQGNETSPITGKPGTEVEATHQIRIGAEYLFIRQKYEIPLCAGVFYDPAPAEGSPDTIFGVSLGSGIGIGKFKFDVAYQYRFSAGNDVGDYNYEVWGYSQDIKEHTLYSSVIVHF